MRNSVLEYAERADDGTIHPSKDERENDKTCNDGYVQRHYCRQELDFGHPAQPSMQCTRKVQQQQRDNGPEQDSEDNTKLLKHIASI